MLHVLELADHQALTEQVTDRLTPGELRQELRAVLAANADARQRFLHRHSDVLQLIDD